jgi:NADH-quinone oxidoreductase subunit E
VLTSQEKAEIDHEISKFPVRKSACLDALLVMQKHRGHVSNESLKLVADYLGMSPTELDGIATFYNLIYRKPVGRCVIRLCDSVSCYIMGYEGVHKRIREDLGITFGETTKDKKFTLLPAQCLGTCDHAPAMMINEETFGDVTPDTVSAIIKLKSQKHEEKDHVEASHRVHEHNWSTP